MNKLLQIFVLALAAVPLASAEQPLSTIPARVPDGIRMSRHLEKIEVKNSMERVDLVFLGDSITHAFDHKGKDAWEKFYGHRNALNIGITSDRTEHILWRLNNGAIDGISPKLLVLMIGTNNTGHRGDSVEDTALGIRLILDNIRAKSPETKILLLAIFPRGRTADNLYRVHHDKINRVIEEYADGEMIHWLDINHIFLDDEGILQQDVMNDWLHPNANQYPRWAEAIEPVVSRLLGE